MIWFCGMADRNRIRRLVDPHHSRAYRLNLRRRRRQCGRRGGRARPELGEILALGSRHLASTSTILTAKHRVDRSQHQQPGVLPIRNHPASEHQEASVANRVAGDVERAQRAAGAETPGDLAETVSMIDEVLMKVKMEWCVMNEVLAKLIVLLFLAA